MSERFTYDIDRTKFETRVSFFSHLVGADNNPSTTLYEDLLNDFIINPAYGEELDAGPVNKDALAEFKRQRPAFIPQCVVKDGSEEKDILILNNIVKIDVQVVSRSIASILMPMLVRLFGPHALGIYRSISYKGIHLDILISDPEKKAESYNTICSILNSHGIPVHHCFKNIVQKSVFEL